MAGVNKVIIIGNLGKDPEVRFMPNGGAVANITLATSDTWKDKQTGEPREKTEWHRVAIFGKLAEIAGEYLKKGSKVYIEGALQTRKWQNQQGQDQYTTEIVVQGFNGSMQMLDSRGQGSFNQQNQGQQTQGGYTQPTASPQSGYSAPQQHGNFQQNTQQAVPQHSGFQQNVQPPNVSSQPAPQQAAKLNPQEPDMDFDDDIPF